MRMLIAIVISVTIVGTGVFFFAKDKEGDRVAKLTTKNVEKSIFSKDSDGDGLKDWEEGLWKTNPNLSDTDNDGTTDLEEIREGRDPTKPGPDDVLEKDDVVKKVNPEIESDLTETDKLSRELFAEYAGQKSMGRNPSIDSYNEILYKTIEKNEAIPPKNVYTFEDLDIIVTKNPEILKDYGNKVAKILLFTPEKPLEHELVLFDNASQTEDPNSFNQYDDIIDLYKKTRNDLLEVSAPEAVKGDHLLLVNSYTALIDSLSQMRQLLSDPVKSVIGFKLYLTASENVVLAEKNIFTFLKENKISFTQKEDGYLLLRGI